MKIFICWSGRRSREFALVLKKWLQRLMPRQIDALLAFLDQPGRSANAPIRAALRDISEAFGLTELAEEVARSTDAPRQTAVRRSRPAVRIRAR